MRLDGGREGRRRATRSGEGQTQLRLIVSVIIETPAPSKNFACEDNDKRIARIASYAGGF
jgi:hypothetical protein